MFNLVDLVILSLKYISCCFYVSETRLSPLPAVVIICRYQGSRLELKLGFHY